MIRVLLKSAVLILLGFSLGWLLFALRRQERPQPARLLPGEVKVKKHKAPARAAPPSKAPERNTPRERWDELRRLISALKVPPHNEAPEPITGEVRTREGKPLAGVIVEAEPNWAPDFADPTWPPSGIERSVLQYIAKLKWHRGAVRRVETGADGRFRLQGLASGVSYDLSFKREGWSFRCKDGPEPQDVEPGQHLVVVALALAEVRLSVLLPDGSEAEEAKIKTSAWEEEYPIKWKREQPVIKVEAGRVEISAMVQLGRVRYFSEELKTELLPGAANEPLVLHVEPRSSIRGKVVFQDFSGPDFIRVFCMPAPGGKKPSLEGLDRFHVNARVASCERSEDYTFEFAGLTPGVYFVAAELDWNWWIIASAIVEVGEEPARCDLVVEFPEPGCYLVVRSYGPHGDLLNDTSVDSVSCSGTAGVYVDSSEIRQEDGSLLLLLSYEGKRKVDPQTIMVELIISNDHYGTVSVSVNPFRQSELEVHFSSPAFLAVSVQGDIQRVLSKLEVSAEGLRETGPEGIKPSVLSKSVEPDGTVTLGPLCPGRYIVRLELMLQDGWLSLISTAISLQPGPNSLTLQMPPVYDLVVEVPGKIRELNLEATDSRSMDYVSCTVGEDRKVVFKDLPAGTYRLISWEYPEGIMTVEVPAAGPVRFEPKPINAFRVQSDPEGIFRESGIQIGDLIVRINGKEFKRFRQAWDLLEEAIATDRVQLTVLRGPQQLDLTLKLKDPSLTFDEVNAGLKPATRN